MIHRIAEIRGIGKFDQPAGIGACQFSKNTIILGPNAEGKSTITDIFRSLKTGDADLLRGRKRCGFAADQRVKICDVDGNELIFPSADWLTGRDEIEIFDNQFIDENIFAGHEVNYEQQASLNSVIIGKDGRDIALQIDTLQGQITQFAQTKAEITRQFGLRFRQRVDYEAFERLPNVINPEHQIDDLDKRIEVVKNQVEIGRVFADVENRLSRILNQGTKDQLSKSIDARADLVVAHIEKTWKDANHPLDFLQTGESLTKESEKDCVFCGQTLNNEAKLLLHAYKQVFSEQYRALQGEVIEAVSKFVKWPPADSIRGIVDRLKSIGANLDITDIDLEHIDLDKSALDTEFARKAKDLGQVVDFTKFDALLLIFHDLEASVFDLKKSFTSVEVGELTRLERELEVLLISIERHSAEWTEVVNRRRQATEQSEEAIRTREVFRARLAAHSETVYQTHFQTINRVLKDLRADFQLVNPRPLRRLIGQRERIFAVQFFEGHDVNLLSVDRDKPNFGNTLSDSDKRVLAFAFFYSILLHDPDVEEKIVVLDDPFSSFDSHRREATIQLLCTPYVEAGGVRVAKDFKQLIILTHEKEYFKWLATKLNAPQSFEIEPDGHVNGVKKSKMTGCDVQAKYLESEDVRNLRAIREVVLANQPLPNHVGWFVKARMILEGIMKRKYFFYLAEDIAGRKGPRRFAETLKDKGISGYDQVPKFGPIENLCVNLNIELHENELENDGANAITVLSNFLDLLKDI